MATRFNAVPSASTDIPAARIAPQLRGLAVPIDSVTLHPRNPRHGDVAAVRASLDRFGQRKPIVVQASTRYVVAGNHLLQAARALGWEQIAANVQDMDDAEATAFMLADNRTSDLGAYDDALLAEILAEQGSLDNLVATGFDEDAIAALLRAAGVEDSRGDPDDAPDRPAAADLYVRAGDLWFLGQHRLLVGDATDPAAVARLTAGARISLVWADPPYGVGYVGKTPARLTIANDALGVEATRTLVTTALQLAPLPRGASFYVMAPTGPLHLEFLLAVRAANLTVHQILVWVKDHLVPGRSDYHARHEAVLFGWRDGAAHYFRSDRTQISVWEFNRPARSERHPTMKPVVLVGRAIRNSSPPGATVYDPFLGSGTTVIAAEMTGRKCLGMEVSPAYCDVAAQRWSKFTGKEARRVPAAA
jgi:DNA modification methylase